MSLKEKIVVESLKLFSLKGFLNTSIEDILSAAGTSKGGFYNHFKSKDDLFLAVLQEAQLIWRERVLKGIKYIEDPLEKIKRILHNYEKEYLKDKEDIPGGCIFVTLSVELDDQRPEFAAEINRGFVGLQNMLKRFVDAAIESETVRKGVSAEEVVNTLFTGMLGSSVLYGINRSDDELHRNIEGLVKYTGRLQNG